MSDTNLSKKQISDSTRIQICSKYTNGKSIAVIAAEVDIQYKAVANIIRTYKLTGRMISKKNRKSKPKKINTDIKTFIDQLIFDDVSVTLKMMKQKINERFNVSVSKSSIQRTLATFNYSFKRVVCVPQARNTRRNIECRYLYAQDMILTDENKIIYIDEFGISCSSRKSYGRSLIGTSPIKTVAAVRSRNFSTCAAMIKNRLLYFKTIDCAYNTEKYGEFLRDLLVTLNNLNMFNCILIMDNCPIHKAASLREMVEANGHTIKFLPPYSPQLNPIEEVFSKWKNDIKSRNCLTTEELYTAILSSSYNLTPQDCNNYYAHVRLFIAKALRKEDF